MSIDQDLQDFEKRLKGGPDGFLDNHDSSSEEEGPVRPKMVTEADLLREKNRILMEKLFKSDKQLQEARELAESISKGATSDIKDKRIIELAKKNRSLQLQVESLKTKAAKAAEYALKLKQEGAEEASSPKKEAVALGSTSISAGGGAEAERRLKEAEKKVTKLRNEK